MRRAAVSRADLLDVLVSAERGGGSFSTVLLGFERTSVSQDSPESLEARGGEPSDAPRQALAEPKPQVAPRVEYPKPRPGQRVLQFVLPIEREVLQPEPLAPEERLAPLTDEEISMPASRGSALVPLAPWSRLAPFLRRRLGRTVASHRLDVRKLARQLASGLPWRRLPRLSRPSWGTATAVLWDISPEMEPFQPDAAELVRRLKRERGRQGLKVCQCFGPPSALRLEPGVPVLTLSALGQLQSDSEVRQGWLSCGNRLLAAGHRLTALVPSPADRWYPPVAACFPSAAWDRWRRLPRRGVGRVLGFEESAGGAGRSPAATERLTMLLDLLALASRITPGLLRRVRLLLGPSADVALEHDVWFHPDTTGSESGRYFGFREGPTYELRLNRLRERAADPATSDLVRRAAEIIREEHHRNCSPMVALAADCRVLLGVELHPGDLAGVTHLLGRAVERMRELAGSPGSNVGYRSGLPAWFCRFVEHGLSSELRADPAIAVVVAQGLALARTFLEDLAAPWPKGTAVSAALAELRRNHGPRRTPVPYQVGIAEGGLRIAPDADVETRLVAARIHADKPVVHFIDGQGAKSSGIPVPLNRPALVPLAASRPIVLESDWERLRLEPMTRPAWASRWFIDRTGAVAEVALADGGYSFRWGLADLSVSSPHFAVSAGGSEFGRELPAGGGRFGWVPTSKPTWASRLWADEYGVGAEFQVRGVTFVLRWIPPGRFLMGSPAEESGRFDDEGPQHEVTLSRGFWMGETPVTQAQWCALRAVNPSEFKGEDRPVEQVDWKECMSFVAKLNTAVPGLSAGLPTEAQWEYACRAGTDGAFHDGSPCTEPEGKDPALDQLGWFDKNSGGETHLVGQKQANGWGLYDMHGNVWEWCRDVWKSDAYSDRRVGVADPEIASVDDSASRVVRGGSWLTRARYCRAAFRHDGHPGDRRSSRGFRLVAGLDVKAAEPRGAERPDGRRGGAGAEGRSPEAKPPAQPWWRKII